MLKGTYTALITPFKGPHNKIDFDCLELLLEEQLKNNIEGVVVLGTTGETPTLLQEEQLSLIAFVVKKLKNQMDIIIGTGTNSTLTTIQQTKIAQDMGADKALVVTPYYNKPTQEGIYKHFEALSSETTLPLIIYNIQSRTGRNIDTDTMSLIAELPPVVGIKEASGNIEQMMDVLSKIHKPSFSVISGDDALTFPLLALGGHGVISVVSNLMPGLVKKMVDLCLEGDFEAARLLHFRLLPLFKGAFLESNPAPIKEAMNIRGLNVGGVRLPLCTVTNETRIKLHEILGALL
ncbi:MAG: 4-hydroxy-tetrahydrodipicolinate synthase [Chlamydiae bacterium]|nr:4-hydroxy-tetrahydrodipicolinate synthase [Chlamydiota bacterium]